MGGIYFENCMHNITNIPNNTLWVHNSSDSTKQALVFNVYYKYLHKILGIFANLHLIQ